MAAEMPEEGWGGFILVDSTVLLARKEAFESKSEEAEMPVLLDAIGIGGGGGGGGGGGKIAELDAEDCDDLTALAIRAELIEAGGSGGGGGGGGTLEENAAEFCSSEWDAEKETPLIAVWISAVPSSYFFTV